MTKKLSLILLSAILLTGCATVDEQPTQKDISQPNETVIEVTTESDNEEVETTLDNIKPALEELYTRADEVTQAGPDSEVTEEEFEERVEALAFELGVMLQSDSYIGTEFLDNALVDLLNIAPERHSDMGIASYDDYYDMASEIAQDIKDWEEMINTI